MILNLRQAIVQRVQDKNNEDLRDIIEDSIGGEERVLPGLGVLFEIIWQNCGTDIQNQLVHTLKEQVTTAKA